MRRLFAQDGSIVVDQVAPPATPANGYLVRGICSLISPGTELGLLQESAGGAKKSLGYSLAGQVIESGPAAPPLPSGQLVACAGYQWAWHADLVAMPPLMVTPIPAGIDPRHAVFTTLGATALHALRQGEVTLGDRVVVIGLGVVGQLLAQVA